jgi:hypothetical protein
MSKIYLKKIKDNSEHSCIPEHSCISCYFDIHNIPCGKYECSGCHYEEIKGKAKKEKSIMKLIKRKFEFDIYGNEKTDCPSFCPKDSSRVFSLPIKRYSSVCIFNCKYYYAHSMTLSFILCKKEGA